MIKCNGWTVALCTWAVDDDFEEINELKQQTQLEHIHLSLIPAFEEGGVDYLSTVQRQDWNITATMLEFPQQDYSTIDSIKVSGGIVPDEYWDTNCKMAFDALDMTAELGVRYFSAHFGFMDPDDREGMKKLCERMKILADRAADKGVQILMETGQETAGELRQFLEKLNHNALVVNFDPANMILYNRDNPIEAVRILAPWIKHVHIKDAIRSEKPGTWGTEVPWGTGQVGADEFLRAIEQINFNGVLAIERTAGDNRIGDIKLAIEKLREYSG